MRLGDGSDMNGSRLTVQFARGSRQRDFPAPDRTHPRPRRTAHRMQISGLPGETSWQVSSLPLPSLFGSVLELRRALSGTHQIVRSLRRPHPLSFLFISDVTSVSPLWIASKEEIWPHWLLACCDYRAVSYPGSGGPVVVFKLSPCIRPLCLP